MNRRSMLGWTTFLISAPNMMIAAAWSQAPADRDAAAYPSRPVKLIVPFAPGGSPDVLGRMLAEALGEDLKGQFVVENPTGAGGSIGISAAARAKPDGYTLLLATPGVVLNPLIYSNVKHDPLRDFEYIGLAWEQPCCVVVRKGSPYDTLAKLIEDAKKNPGRLKFASGGVGTFNHLAGELFASAAGIQLTHVPYRGIAPGLVDVINGQVDIAMATVSALLTGRDHLSGLAISSQKRSSFAPDVPTAAEAGVPGWQTSTWGGLAAPAGTPKTIVEKVSRALATVLTKGRLVDKFRDAGVEVRVLPLGEFAQFIRTEQRQASALIKRIGLDPK